MAINVAHNRLKHKKLFGTEISCTGCESHTGYLAHRNSKGEAKGICKHQNYSNKSRRKERGHEEEKSQTRPN